MEAFVTFLCENRTIMVEFLLTVKSLALGDEAIV